ncbi:kelch-like protein diablo isoform X2 [Ornithodoros turicata]|uniref:kelch-like protein diablo isoform X2 n=1 Tax=Ornithodoros turicata TaxID=34597 RepID=UPI0031396981
MPVGKNCLVVVSIPSTEFTIDSDVISAASPFLKEMLIEVSAGQRLRLQMEGVTKEAFEAFRSYLQTGSMHLTCRNVTDVYRCGYKLQVRGMVTRCLQYLAEVGPVGRQIVLFANARKHGLRDDQQAALSFLVENFDAAIRSREFLELPWEPLMVLLNSDCLGTANETSVFIAALAWLHQDYGTRKQWEEAVLGCVRFPLLSEDVLLQCLEPPLAHKALENRTVRKRIIEAAFYHYTKLRGRPELGAEFKPRTRTFLGASLPPITWSSDGKIENFETRSYAQSQNYRRKEASQRVCCALLSTTCGVPEAVESKTDQAFALLRRYYEAHVRKVVAAQAAVRSFLARRRYAALHAQVQPPPLLGDPAEQELMRRSGARDSPAVIWAAYPSQRLPRHTGPLSDPDCAMVLVSGGIEPARSHEMGTGCAVLHLDPRSGGFDSRNTHVGLKFATGSCFRMDLATREWERIADMRYARCNHVALAHAGRIYAVAGQDEYDTFLGSVEEYAPDANTWRELGPPLPCRLSAPGAAVDGGTLVVAGGMVQSQRGNDKVFVSSAVYRWDSKQARWVSSLPPLTIGRGSFALVSHQGHLHAIGGLIRASDGSSLDVVRDVHVLKNDSWVKGLPLPKPLHGCQALSLTGGPIVVIGGLSTATLVAPTDEIWRLDEAIWTNIAKLPSAVAGMAAAAIHPQDAPESHRD